MVGRIVFLTDRPLSEALPAIRALGADGPLDLNTATLEQLDGLPGVGPATAQAILDYRAAHGAFHSINELLRVRGIGDARFAALRARVRV